MSITINENFSNLPFFCFKDENVSLIEKLNFNQLKKCKLNERNKYMVIFLGKFNNEITKHSSLTKNFDAWHNNNPTVKLELTTNSSTYKELVGTMLKIFRPQYKPATSE